MASGEAGETGLALIDGLPIGDFGLGALVTFAIIMIFTGKLVPKRFLDDAIAREKAQAAINATNADTLAQMGGALRDLVELGRTADHMLRSIAGSNGDRPQREATTS